MKHYLSTVAILALSVTSVLAPNAMADERDKKTTITINQSIEIADTVLPVGSYVIKLLDQNAGRHIVQIFDAEQSHLINTVFTVPIYSAQAANKSEFRFYESDTDQPPTLHTWFYPGDTTGFEFRAGHGAAPRSDRAAADSASIITASN